MSSFLIIGECMLELNAQSEKSYSKAFAGDSYNCAVYAKRWQPNLKVSYLTTVGTDSVSDEMLKEWASEGIDCSLVMKTESAQPGIYMISTDDEGERSFSYWRKDSAATQLMQVLAAAGGAEAIPYFDYVYFSGISLAILNEVDKKSLLDLIQTLRKRGAKVAFDPNYRASMWQSDEHAKYWLESAYQCCDIAMPGLDEHKVLFKQTTPQEVREQLQGLGVRESVVKCGEQGVCSYGGNDSFCHLPFTPAENQLDSTAAGDSFAGTYLASRIVGQSRAESLENANKIAGFVVQHKGAIVNKLRYQEFVNPAEVVPG